MLIKKSQALFKDLGTKTIRKYTSPDKQLEVNCLTVNGRHPEEPGQFIYEVGVAFMVYVIKGKGKFWVGEKEYIAEVGDVLYIPRATKFAVEGKDLEYLTFETPAWYSAQAFIVDGKGKVIENTKN